MKSLLLGIALVLCVGSCGEAPKIDVQKQELLLPPTPLPGSFCSKKPVVPMTLVGGLEVPITSSTSTWSKAGFATSTFHPVPANFRTSNVSGRGALYRDDDNTGGFAIGCSTNFNTLLYAGGANGTSAPIAGGITGCQSYLMSIGGICLWDDGHLTAMPDGAFYVFTGAAPNRWINHAPGVQSPGGWTVTLTDYIQ